MILCSNIYYFSSEAERKKVKIVTLQMRKWDVSLHMKANIKWNFCLTRDWYFDTWSWVNEIANFFIGIKIYMKNWSLETSKWFTSFHADDNILIICYSSLQEWLFHVTYALFPKGFPLAYLNSMRNLCLSFG